MNLLTVINQVKTFILFLLMYVQTSTVQIPELFHIYGQTNQDKAPTNDCHIQIAHCVIRTLDWKRFHVVFSGEDVVVASEMLSTFDHIDLDPPQASLWGVSNFTRERIYDLLSLIYGDGYDDVRIVLVLNNDTSTFLQIAGTFDDVSNKTTNYQTNSKWIVLDLLDLSLPKRKSFLKLRDVFSVRSSEAFALVNNQKVEVDCLEGKNMTLSYQCSNLSSVDEIYPEARFNLNGRHLRIGTINSEYFGGIVRELSRALAQTLNFTYTFHIPEDGQYGYDVNGSWGGVIGQLQRRDVDLAVAELTVTKERMKVVDFIRPAFLSQEFGILYRRGAEVESTWTRIFTPLRVDVYWCILASLFFVAGLLYLLDNSGELNFRCCHIVNVIVVLVGFVSVRGGGFSPRTESARVMVAVFWMFCIVLTGVYIGNLTAKITETREKKPFDSIEELLQTDWKWGVQKDGLLMQMIRASKVKSIQELWKGVVRFNKTDPRVLNHNFRNHLEYVLNTSWKYAYIVLDPEFYILNRNDCRIATTEANIISNLQIALAVPKQSYLKPELERVMAKFLDNGLISRIYEWRYKDNRPWTCKNPQTIRTTNLEDVQGLLLIVCVGLGVALVVLLLEVLAKRFQRG